MVPGGAECQTNGELRASRKIEAAGQSNVAVESRFVLPVQAIVVSQVRPAVVHADVAARTFSKRDAGADHEPRTSLVGGQKGVSSYPQNLPVVMPPANLEVRRAKDVHPQLWQ